MKIIQVVGYKNSGKTTLASQIIGILASKGLRVASLKHHGHGGLPLGFENTDSEKHKQAGAIIAGVEGEGVLQLSADTWDVDQMTAIYRWVGTDVLVIEGYKQFSFPKVVLINETDDLSILQRVDNVTAIVTSITLNKAFTDSYLVFYRNALAPFYEWISRTYVKK
ncbi:MAG TPA: molybdopterin-guanine dinucleotide biosynthesis protein B [Bacillota bacterium]|nr:molybdopterin-guanine dinucleotide biosynthesis protein B [Bacillota bacterium]